MLEDLMYEELERVLDKMKEYALADKIIPIQEAYYCYAVSLGHFL